MNLLKYLIALLLLSSGPGCSPQPQKKATADFRLLNMIPDTKGTLEIQGKGAHREIHMTQKLSFGREINYRSLPAGYYEFIFSVQGKKLLQGEYALGKNGDYTLLVTGLLPEQWTVNPRSITYKLKHWVAGSELADPNQNMPQWFMMRDNIEVTGSRAHLRIVNANPYLSTVSVSDSGGTLGSGLWYPKVNELQSIRPGRHKLRVTYGNIKVGEQSFNFKAGSIYTLLIGAGRSSTGEVTLRLLENSAEQ